VLNLNVRETARLAHHCVASAAAAAAAEDDEDDVCQPVTAGDGEEMPRAAALSTHRSRQQQGACTTNAITFTRL